LTHNLRSFDSLYGENEDPNCVDKNWHRQIKCVVQSRHVADLAGTKAEVKKAEVRFTAGIAARRESTWRGPPEMTALWQDITVSPYRTFFLVSLIGLLLQIHSTTGKCFS